MEVNSQELVLFCSYLRRYVASLISASLCLPATIPPSLSSLPFLHTNHKYDPIGDDLQPLSLYDLLAQSLLSTGSSRQDSLFILLRDIVVVSVHLCEASFKPAITYCSVSLVTCLSWSIRLFLCGSVLGRAGGSSATSPWYRTALGDNEH